MPRHSPCALISLISSKQTSVCFRSLLTWEKSNNWFSSYKELCRLILSRFFCFAKIVIFTLNKIIYPLLLPSHNCIIIISLCSVFKVHVLSFQETQWSFNSLKLQSISWWRLAGSNRWPPACKAGALPAELNPHIKLKWWAKMDSNHRPHDYQSCALASWAIGPYRLLTS